MCYCINSTRYVLNSRLGYLALDCNKSKKKKTEFKILKKTAEKHTTIFSRKEWKSPYKRGKIDDYVLKGHGIKELNKIL